MGFTEMEFATQTQFDYLYEGLKQKYPGLFQSGPQTVFQFMEMPMEARWIDSEHREAFELADTIPAKLGGFYSTGSSRLTVAYETFIKSIAQEMGSNNPKYRQLKERQENILNYMKKVEADAEREHKGWLKKNPDQAISYDLWLSNTRSGKIWTKELDDLDKEYEEIKEGMSSIKGAVAGALAVAQKYLTQDKMILEDGESVLRTTIGGDLQKTLLRWQAHKDQYDLDVTINRHQHIENPWHTTVNADIRTSLCHGQEIHNRINVSQIIQDKHYNLQVKAVGVEGFPITRGKWYNDSFVHHDVKIAEGGNLNMQNFFGPDGSLHLIPTAILVIYHPVIELTISTETFENTIEHSDFFKTGAAPGMISLFGLQFDTKTTIANGIRKAADKTTITILPPENQAAQILGITSVNKSIPSK